MSYKQKVMTAIVIGVFASAVMANTENHDMHGKTEHQMKSNAHSETKKSMTSDHHNMHGKAEHAGHNTKDQKKTTKNKTMDKSHDMHGKTEHSGHDMSHK